MMKGNGMEGLGRKRKKEEQEKRAKYEKIRNRKGER